MSVAVPDPPVTRAGEKVPPPCDGARPARDRSTSDAKPCSAPTDTPTAADDPGDTVTDVGDAATVKSGVVASHWYAAATSSRP